MVDTLILTVIAETRYADEDRRYCWSSCRLLFSPEKLHSGCLPRRTTICIWNCRPSGSIKRTGELSAARCTSVACGVSVNVELDAAVSTERLVRTERNVLTALECFKGGKVSCAGSTGRCAFKFITTAQHQAPVLWLTAGVAAVLCEVVRARYSIFA